MDSDADDEWPNTELAEQSEGNTDDHINYACNPATGELYIATKDSFDNHDLYIRDPAGSWRVSENFINGSRPLIIFDASGNQLFGLSYQFVWSGLSDELIFNPLSVGNWGQSKDMTSTQQPCDSNTGIVIAKKHYRQLELLYIPLEGPPSDQVDWVHKGLI